MSHESATRATPVASVLAVVVVCLCASQRLAAQETVYVLPSDLNVLMSWGFYQVSDGVTYADDAHLANSNLEVNQLSVSVVSTVARSATVAAALYDRTAGGAPNNLLWSSTRSVSFAQPLNNTEWVRQIIFGPVDVIVPQDLCWAIRFTDITNYDINVPELSYFGLLWNEADNLALGSPPGTSTDALHFYQKNPAQAWQQYSGPLVGGEQHDGTLTAMLTATLVP